MPKNEKQMELRTKTTGVKVMAGDKLESLTNHQIYRLDSWSSEGAGRLWVHQGMRGRRSAMLDEFGLVMREVQS
jgi:hypothetical protein